jgi:1-acyl-sn-glycerol-3-phosphate acyltransferase
MRTLLHIINGSFSAFGYFVNTVFWVFPIVFLSILKIIPIKVWQKLISFPLDGCATAWISINNINQNLFSRTRFDVKGLEGLSSKEWYLVTSNHQSWVDILVLQRIFNHKIPFLKFFLKKELIWVPFIGIAWWALDFPFMRRYSRAFLNKNPHLKGKDLETTKKACERFKRTPISVMNFVEGTRCTPEKYAKHNSNFKHLLAPKAGGIAYTLQAMGQQLSEIIDVTIVYQDAKNSLWDMLSGQIQHVKVYLRTIPITDDLIGDYQNDKQFRVHFQQWLNKLWHEKDALLAKELANNG